MAEAVTHTRELFPRNIGIFPPQIIGYVLRSLTNDMQLHDHGALRLFVSGESLEIHSDDEFVNQVDRTQNVANVKR